MPSSPKEELCSEALRPEAPAVELGETLEDRGRARRWALAGEVRRELWRLPESDEQLARRLLRLAGAGVGGFSRGGRDDEGIWLIRDLPPASLEQLRRERSEPWDWRRAVGIAKAVARALAACEAVSLFPGPVMPKAIALNDATLNDATLNDAGEPRVVLPAEALIGAMVGAPAPRGGTETGPKGLLWSPPEKLDDALWDASANRYAVGVLLYDLIAGQHPFGGAGLRHALRESRDAEAAPFAPEVARQLPAGLQSLCLRLIAREPQRRPDRAEAIVTELAAIEEGLVAEERASAPSPRRSPEPRSEQVTGEQPRARERRPTAAPRRLDLRWLLTTFGSGRARLLPSLLGLLACGFGLAFALQAPRASDREPPARASVGADRPVSSDDTLAADCASCHPRHAAEWSQSVMGHSVKSPLFNALEALIEEQVGRDRDCPGGAGILRRADAATACRSPQTGLAITGSGGEHWCVNCHAAGDNLGSRMPAWQGRAGGDPRSRQPVKDLIGEVALEGISCAFCHQVHGPVGPGGSPGYQGNPTWRSFVTGATFPSRPEDRRGEYGIANSGYRLDPLELLLGGRDLDPERVAVTSNGFAAHARPTAEARDYLASSRFCGSCHDVRLFGTDVIGARQGEHFKRLRNAYSEWADWARSERAAGRQPASCQGCHMSTYPGVCEPGERPDDDPIHDSCPEGMRFSPRAPGQRVSGRVAQGSTEATALSPHYFAGVDLPLAPEITDEALAQPGLDPSGIPLSARRRRDMLLRASMELTLGEARREGGRLEIPVVVENVGAGHKVPAGFSQEREIWVHLRVEDGAGRLVYEVGRVDRNDEDLHDKIFLRVSTDPDRLDAQGRPVGLFGADVRDGPDVPQWSPPVELGGRRFRGRGLINFQNGFLRCVRCIGRVGPGGECLEAGSAHRAERFADGDYDIDTGECRSNLSGRDALLEIYFPVGSLDADRGLPKGPDAIIDTRSLPPGRQVQYVYDLSTRGRRGPFRVRAQLMFRSFPPFLVRAFAEYEAKQAARGRRPSGPLVTFDMMERLERVVVDRASLVVP